MSTDLKRMTFSVTPEIEASLKSFKKEMFYDRSQSDMIRTLVSAGMRALETEKTAKEDEK
ncbi:MAG: hypothetical protein GX425_00740 [Peptococcaceae bacterium]|jgi:hypothetical protein|nr:hypothetical protein [Peptococcaceae bacterium]